MASPICRREDARLTSCRASTRIANQTLRPTRYASRMNPATDTPFAGLSPDAILDAIESLGIDCDGRLLALNSYENRVFRIGVEDSDALVAKFYRPQRWSDAAILEEHAFSNELTEAGLSVVSPLRIGGATLHRHGDWRFALFALQGGHAPEPGDPDILRQLGRTIGRMHSIGALRGFRHRPVMDPERFGERPLQALLRCPQLPPELAHNLATLGQALLARIRPIWQLCQARSIRLHGDIHPGNLLWRQGQVHFVDLDDCLSGPACQDLWMLLSGPRSEQEAQLGCLLEGYSTFADFDPGELRLIDPLRSMRVLHYNAWVAQRWHDPAFPAAFPWFGERRHWESLIRQVQEQLAEFDEPPLQWH
jgi:Ser/Thr protein kinase RdoA (MazF antagonist)